METYCSKVCSCGEDLDAALKAGIDAKAAVDAMGTLVKSVNGFGPDANGNVTVEIDGAECNIPRIESLDEGNLVNLRDLESGQYILYGYFSPYANSDIAITADNSMVSVIRKAAGSHVICLDPLNAKIVFFEMLEDETEPKGIKYTRTIIPVLDLGKVKTVNGISPDENGNVDAAGSGGGSDVYVLADGETIEDAPADATVVIDPNGEPEDVGGTDISLNVSGATPGQIVKISSVDEAGKPTAWEAVDMPSGGGSGARLISSVTVEEEVSAVSLPLPEDRDWWLGEHQYVLVVTGITGATPTNSIGLQPNTTNDWSTSSLIRWNNVATEANQRFILRSDIHKIGTLGTSFTTWAQLYRNSSAGHNVSNAIPDVSVELTSLYFIFRTENATMKNVEIKLWEVLNGNS
jgi:hypothetical protein